MVRTALHHDKLLLSQFIETCSSLGFSAYAHSVFSVNSQSHPHIYVFNTMIKGMTLCNSAFEALLVFDEMPLASVCSDDVVVWMAMIAGYVKVGDPDTAMDLLSRMPRTQTDGAVLITWTSVIAGYAQMDRPDEAIAVFRKMQLENVVPDEIAMLAVLSACAQLGAFHIRLGECIHGYVKKRGFDQMVTLKNALIEMYSNSGNISNALHVFMNMTRRTVISWTTIISALAFHGLGTQALDMFSRMEMAQVKPNVITFIAVLSACAHVGLVDLGRYYFHAMKYRYGIQHEIQHYGCMIDLLGRAGYLAEALKLVSEMPFQPNAAIWGSLLAASNIHGDAELGELALLHLVQLEPWNSGNYALLSNIYASAGRWDKSVMARKMMRDKGVRKMPGWSFIQVSTRTHEFIAGDTSHPQFDRIHGTLFTMNEQMKTAHYDPINEFDKHDSDIGPASI
ncbi:hypothetical protein Goarm_010579, partial [Gossypium armourianum]|nr:hypothetical protein [Gossypium armourianum]